MKTILLSCQRRLVSSFHRWIWMRAFTGMTVFSLACSVKPITPPQQLNLVVAASVGPASTEIAAQLGELRGMKINVQSGASSLIARQIGNGLPCDVVILADDEWMNYLSTKKSIIDSTRRHLLSNRLVWISSAAPTKSSKGGRIAMADPDHVPAGKYAKAALSALGKWDEVSRQVAAAPDVRTALLWVERGEVERGIVYESDALSSSKVKVTSRIEEIPARPIRFPIAQCTNKGRRAQELYQLLTAPSALEIFKFFGFQIVMPNESA